MLLIGLSVELPTSSRAGGMGDGEDVFSLGGRGLCSFVFFFPFFFVMGLLQVGWTPRDLRISGFAWPLRYVTYTQFTMRYG